MTYLEHYFRLASQGNSVLLVGYGFTPFSARVNEGHLFIRNHGSSLKSIAVNIVVFFGLTPEDVKHRCVERMSLVPYTWRLGLIAS